MAVLMREQSPDDTDADFQMGYLLHFHQRLGHLAYDSIERLAKDPASGIKFTYKAAHLYLVRSGKADEEFTVAERHWREFAHR